MFEKIKSTTYAPTSPILIWDGDCAFCKFWKTRWELQTEGKLAFRTYQESAALFPDIPIKEFKKASRLITPDGKMYSGPDSAYRSLYIAGNTFWHSLYTTQKWFTWLSDHGYNHIAKNRSFYYKVTQAFFGRNPRALKHFWIIYVLLISVGLALILVA